jgi:hypothetical protein
MSPAPPSTTRNFLLLCHPEAGDPIRIGALSERSESKGPLLSSPRVEEPLFVRRVRPARSRIIGLFSLTQQTKALLVSRNKPSVGHETQSSGAGSLRASSAAVGAKSPRGNAKGQHSRRPFSSPPEATNAGFSALRYEANRVQFKRRVESQMVYQGN